MLAAAKSEAPPAKSENRAKIAENRQKSSALVAPHLLQRPTSETINLFLINFVIGVSRSWNFVERPELL